MFDNKIHNWCCFSDIESKFPEMWNDSTEAKKACNYCEKQYDMIEKSLLIVLDYYKHGKLPAELTVFHTTVIVTLRYKFR